ncbi:3-oxoadipate enol-lactonase [Hydrogenophaga laconesensis]|uniref:3-oxoadipate enol-lactonase n=1 Tax=Hydrogenophaga laconesensis TaxID=1805971 RepID=A0ABU1V767_9BURK|nr:3-oxoadipate enol-lactonase [Hydrogenophaga laconesensis]MDR7093230.1 3-oxoadipate enol-lactonase [Hydrogenophaga laconesensis]
MATIETRGELFNVALDGPAGAPAIMLSNSVGTTLNMWDGQLQNLVERFRVVRYDVRGQHKASRATGEFTLEQLGRDAIALLDELDIRSAHWCGVSMGGVIGQWIAIHEPSRLRSLVLANTAPYLGPPQKWQDRIESVRKGGTASIAEASVLRWFTEPFRQSHPATVQAAKEQLIGTRDSCYIGCAAALRDLDLRAQVERIAAPTLIIGGTHDLATPIADSHFLHASIKGSRLIELNAAHLSNIEQCEAFNLALHEFLPEECT